MNSQNLIIFRFPVLFRILKEVEKELNFSIFEELDENLLNQRIKELDNCLVFAKKKTLNLKNEFIFDGFPVKLSKLTEKLNIIFLKQKSNNQSEIIIGNYQINLNSREMFLGKIKLKLTEKEINSILYMSKSNKTVSVEELRTKVWGYQSDTETHTVETHIYRLRKKISKIFEDNNFIISKKNGYKIN